MPTDAPSRLPPFSLVEFGDLVSAALDPPGDALSFPNAPLFSLSSHTIERKKSIQNLNVSQSHSRVRRILSKLKKRAAALVKRPRPRLPVRFRHASSKQQPLREQRVQSSVLSVTPTPALDEGLDPDADDDSLVFAPYLPLVAQYERMAPYAYAYAAPSLPEPSYASPSLSAFGVSRVSTSSCSPGPPSPTASSFSGSSSDSASRCSSSFSTATHSPTLPTYSLHGQEHGRWSVLSVDSFVAGDREAEGAGAAYDPFAKGAVRVVHRSCEALPGPTPGPYSSLGYAYRYASPATPSSGRMRMWRARVRGRRRGVVSPGPSPAAAEAEDAERLEAEEAEDDWTLSLPHTPRTSTSTYTSDSPLTSPPSPSSPTTAATPHYCTHYDFEARGGGGGGTRIRTCARRLARLGVLQRLRLRLLRIV
ncbi:hypothetical protein B0H11DRAFT_2057005 [Mycena galericulata]|nr:hypothetical protein B0H11DRAFT_2057005 [Mycena galericulata]